MDVLVTGCAGFIGSKVTESLLPEGHRVVGIDNLNDAYDVVLKHWRLSRLEGRPGFTFHRCDITDGEALRGLFSDLGPATVDLGAVIHLAARAGVRQSVETPKMFYETNVDGTLNLLELCRELGVEKFVLASTSSLYGSHNPRPFVEDADTSRPLSPYAASKKAAETLCYTYHYLHGLDVSVLRYFTVYGPAGRPDMSIFRFIRWIAEGEPLMLFGDGSQERDFTYVDDIAAGTVRALKSTAFEVINLGSDRPVAMNQIIGMLERLIGQKADTQQHPVQVADVPGTWADISKANRILSWKPQTTLEDGLQEAVHWYQQNRDWARKVSLS